MTGDLGSSKFGSISRFINIRQKLDQFSSSAKEPLDKLSHVVSQHLDQIRIREANINSQFEGLVSNPNQG
jgi:hypothetical protein